MRISDGSSDVCSSVLLEQVDTVDDRLAALGGGLGARLADRLLQGDEVVDHEDDVALLAQHLHGQHLLQLRDAGLDIEHERGRADEHRGNESRRRSEEHTSELQSLMRISYAVFCLKKTKNNRQKYNKSSQKQHDETERT